MIVRSSLSGGVDGSNVTDGNKIEAYGKFKNAEETDIGLLIGGESSATVALELIAIAEGRKDCVAVLSPEKADVVNNSGNEVDDVIDFRNALGSTSYAVLDSGWKYQYDRYNDVYRYVPLNGDTAGVTAATEANRDAWFSPAGFSRGNILNVIKLPFSPRNTQRDSLYKNNINPIEDALTKLRSISGNTFEWNEELSGKTGSDTGVIAQEIEAIDLPGIVTTRDNGYKAVKYERLTALLIEAVKELADKVDNLEQKLSDK